MNETKISAGAGNAAGTSDAKGVPGLKTSHSIGSLHPLDRAAARVNRAQEHLAELVRRIAARGQTQGEAISSSIRPNPTDPKQIVLNPRQDLPLDLMFSILVGEVCYNLRAALDYLVFELAKVDSGKEQAQTQFPIEYTAEEFRRRIPQRLKGVNSAHVGKIEALQPYSGCTWTGRLKEISNPDKHRTLVATRAEHELTVHVADKEHLADFKDMPGAIHTTVTADGTEVYVKLLLGTALQFADGSRVIEPLEEIMTQVALTLERFRPEFT